ncbi:tetratricopeptide repeat protein [Mucilaginibacter yixingensis]|uniref:histidine kinase n=1 Tax=Mucilaginibacter yixingensis TaxID=1295612 RepID=A0A2T5J5K6_9SPHI|nr:tetratricopeptide repeat-containing sensor histidine kinase [Mucilaginibacter yixingensis]PTQ93553.1 tetratricopeptide repeat protein [Mucilaginibacter yixingensis]
MRWVTLLLLFLSVSLLAFQSADELHGSSNSQSDSSRVAAYLNLSKDYTANQPDSAVEYCNRGLQLAERENNQHAQGLFLLQLGIINSTHHHAGLARKFFNEAISVFRHQHDKEDLAKAYDELGVLDADQKNDKQALREFNYSMNYYRDAQDTSGILETYHGLGAVFEQAGDTEKALSYYLRALVQYEHRSTKSAAYFSLLDRIGHLYLKKGNTLIALRYLQEGVDSSNTPAARDTQLTMLDEEGSVYEREGQRDKALAYYKQELLEAKRYKKPEDQVKALISIARVLKGNNSVQSLQDLKSALKIASGLHEPRLEASIFEAMAAVYQQQNDFREAMFALEEQHHLLDSLLNADTAKDIVALDNSYKLETSQERISDLQQTNKKETRELYLGWVVLAATIIILGIFWAYLRKVRKLNDELKASNRIKDTLFSIIGHDLKGPAGSAAQMFAIMETEHFSEEELRVMIGELRKQTEASFDLLNALFEWGKAQLNGVKVKAEDVNLQEFAERTVSLLSSSASAKNISIYNNIQTPAWVNADPHHVDFVLRNLISNAIKFTFDGGSIEINLETDGDAIISVKDTGKGISAAQQEEFAKGNIEVSFGTKGEKGSGLGLLLTKEFIAANNGRVWLNSREGKGTTFSFSLPLIKQPEPVGV